MQKVPIVQNTTRTWSCDKLHVAMGESLLSCAYRKFCKNTKHAVLMLIHSRDFFGLEILACYAGICIFLQFRIWSWSWSRVIKAFRRLQYYVKAKRKYSEFERGCPREAEVVWRSQSPLSPIIGITSAPCNTILSAFY